MRRLALLAAVAWAVPLLAQAERLGVPPATRVLGDQAAHQVGPWTGYMQPFNKGALRAGDTSSQTMTVTPAAFPGGTTFAFAWPAGYGAPGVWGFNAIDYGNYYNTAAAAPITPRQVKAITTLTQTHDVAVAGGANAGNVIFDAFLTQGAGDFSDRIEIDWQLRAATSARAYIVGLPNRGTWTDPQGQTWTLHTDPSRTDLRLCLYVLGAAGEERLASTTIDVRSLLARMVALGLITGNEWYNGHGLGVEPVQGAGRVTVNSLAVTYD